jgi:hypothetical protein
MLVIKEKAMPVLLVNQLSHIHHPASSSEGIEWARLNFIEPIVKVCVVLANNFMLNRAQTLCFFVSPKY